MKIDTIYKTDRTIRFKYNPMQQRVAKYTKPNCSTAEKRTYYVRDAQGNVMAVYSAWVKNNSGAITWDSMRLSEQYLYGSSRLGAAQPNVKLYPIVPKNPHRPDSSHYAIQEAWKRYELTNHLGNVLAIVSDRKIAKSVSGTGPIEWYEPDVLSAQQYYPFGMLMPGRQYTNSGYDYRYGFNGKEGDDEVKGDDNQLDYGARIFDSRVGRWLSVDPLSDKYPSVTPYHAFANSPLFYVDPDGKEIKPIYSLDNDGKLVIKLQVTGKVIDLSNKWFSPATEFTEELNASASTFGGLATGINIEFGGKKFTEATVAFEFNIEKVDKISDISESDHLFVLAPYRNLTQPLATGITNMEGGKVIHIDADFASGPVDDIFDNGLKTGLHELFSHGMGAGHRTDSGTLTYGGDVTGRLFNEKLSDSDRGLIANFIYNNKANKGVTLVPGEMRPSKYPNTSVLGIDEKGKPVPRSISDAGFDTREEKRNANGKQK